MRNEPKQDHYKTLGLPQNASREDIRRAFRAMTKKYHPDRNVRRKEWATIQMREVIEANRVLSDGTLRSAYDRERDRIKERAAKRSNLRPKGRPEGSSPRACSERVLYDLLSNNVAQAIKDYEKLDQGDGRFDLADHMELRDWIDCKFLLAEGYEKRSQFDKALAMYEDLYNNGTGRHRSSFFRNEIRDRIVRICCQGPSRNGSPEEAAQYYLRALALDLPRSRKAFIHKKIAECHLSVGDKDAARRHLAIAFEFKPDLKGVTKICNRLGFSPGQAKSAS